MGFKTSIKGKIIVIFLLGSIALVGSYFVNKLAFGEIRSSVSALSFTHRKLFLVNKVFFAVNESEKSFRNLLNNDQSAESFLLQSGSLKHYTDSLRVLCRNNTYQTLLIDSINDLFKTREGLLLNYVAFRRSIKNNNTLLQQTRILDSIISSEKINADSLVFTKEKSKVTTTTDSVITQEEQDKRGFWNRLFKAKKKEPRTVKTIIEEKTDTQTDTIVQTQKNALVAEAQKIITEISDEQRARRKRFLNREAKLAAFENTFHNKITSLLSEIEKDIAGQTSLTHDRAETSIRKSMNGVYFIIAGFFLFAIIFVFLMLADVTKANKYRLLLEAAREEAEGNSRSRQRFLSNMSHEIRTPLQSIIGYTEQISQQQVPDSTYIHAIHNAAGHLLQVINEILDYSKINSGLFTFERNDFEVLTVVTEVTGILDYQAANKGIALYLEHDGPDDETVTGDAFRLRQVLLNLIGNAIKFTEEGSVRVRVTHADKKDKVLYTFSITDTGIGIPLHMQRHIFDRFEQATLTPDQRYKGTGLGLSIAKALVHGQGGSIDVKSEEGKGTSFTFQIMYDRAYGEENASLIPERALLSTVTYPDKVWLVDDDQLILRLCSDILAKHNIAHRCFDSAEALLCHEAYEAPTIILMDIRMPGINGLQLFSSIKATWPEPPLMVALTSQALPEERAELMQHGFDRLLLKPFREQELLALLSTTAQQEEDEEMSHDPAQGQLDITLLKGMFPGDPEEIHHILQDYCSETKKDMELLKAARSNGFTDDTMMILHRLAGRTAQIGARETGALLRQQEIALRNKQTPALTDTTDIALEKLEQLLSEITDRWLQQLN